MHKTLIFGITFAITAAAGADRTVWDGVYTADQAARGQAAFDRDCRSCHRAGFQGPRFTEHWREDKLSSLLDFMRSKMPADAPGSKTRAEYLDIVAYILSVNNFPAGSQDLTVGTIFNVQFVGKDGPAPLPTGALVRVVGCLVEDPGEGWALSMASGLARTRAPEKSTGAELQATGSQSLGTSIFRLPEIEFQHPDSHRGHKVEIKGYLDRQPEGDRVLVTSLQTLATGCPE
jgi:hypothetical protein